MELLLIIFVVHQHSLPEYPSRKSVLIFKLRLNSLSVQKSSKSLFLTRCVYGDLEVIIWMMQ